MNDDSSGRPPTASALPGEGLVGGGATPGQDGRLRVTRLLPQRHETIDQAVARALRVLRQDAMGRDVAIPLTDDETAWLDADAG